MSKKPGRKSGRKAVATRRPTTKKGKTGKATSRAGATPSNRTAAATIFVYDSGSGPRIRTSPQFLTAAPGWIEWTVVNLTSNDKVDVVITWPKGGPWGGAPIPVTNGNARLSLAGAKEGRFKYSVTANGYTEDPELEWPEF